MDYLEFLERLHGQLAPRTYFEIGVREGASLALSRCPSIGVDPAYEIAHDLQEQIHLVRRTSDDFFNTLGRAQPFGDRPIDFAFIDGLHLFEYAMRDFANVERHSNWSTVIAVDDVYPRNISEAARTRHTQFWTGDIFRVPLFLESHRRDLVLLRVDTEPTGLLLILCPDPTRAWEPFEIDSLTQPLIHSDPQDVPQHILSREDAYQPDEVLSWSLWPMLAERRERIDVLDPRDFIRTALEAQASLAEYLRHLRGTQANLQTQYDALMADFVGLLAEQRSLVAELDRDLYRFARQLRAPFLKVPSFDRFARRLFRSWVGRGDSESP
jgi:hypothetical protein